MRGIYAMATSQAPSLGERLIQPVTNLSDFIWGGTWNGVEVLPFPPMTIILLGIGLWIMVGLKFYPIINAKPASRSLMVRLA